MYMLVTDPTIGSSAGNLAPEISNKSRQTPIVLHTTRHLIEGDVDLWLIDLNRDPAETELLFELLTDDEKTRANKYVFAKDRQHFVACRATLRKILSGYLGISPEEIEFSVRHYGKPYLSGVDRDLRFNVSHSNGTAVIAVTMNREVGVDIEFVDPNFDVFSVASSAFSTEEVSRLRSLPLTQQAAAFFTGWTRKEAFLKAMGDGLSSSDELQNAISFISDEDASYQPIESGKATDWSLTSIEIGDDFKGALVVEGKIGRVRHRQLSEGASGLESFGI